MGDTPEPAPVVIRPAVFTDGAALHAVESAAFSGGYGFGTIRQLLAVLDGFVLVAEIDDEIAGYVISSPVVASPTVGRVLNVGVLPAFRRRGAGRALIEEGTARLGENGVTEIRLTVDPARTHAVRP